MKLLKLPAFRTAAVLVLTGLALVIFVKPAPPAEAALAGGQTCTRTGNPSQSWNHGGFHYVTYQIGIKAGDGTLAHPHAGSYIRSQDCTGTYGRMSNGQWIKGAMQRSHVAGFNPNAASNIDRVWGDSDLFGWVQAQAGTRRIRPSGVELGIPMNKGNPNNGRNVSWPKQCISGFPSTINPPVAECSDAPTLPSSSSSRMAAFVDDSGRLVVGGRNGDRTIWCAGLDTRITNAPPAVKPPSSYRNCPPDVINTGNPSNPRYWKNGAGFLFRHDQCVATAYYNNQFGGCNAYDNWYGNFHGSVDFTDEISKIPNNTTRNAYLESWYNHFDARNSRPHVLAALNFITLKYTLNNARCEIVRTQPGSVTYRFVNTGTRFWRHADGYRLQVGSNFNQRLLSDSDIILGRTNSSTNNGGVKEITINNPVGAIRLYQDMGNGIRQNVGNICAISGGFTITPEPQAHLDDTENPTKATFIREYEASVPEGNTIRDVRFETEYYIKRYSPSSKEEIRSTDIIHRDISIGGDLGDVEIDNLDSLNLKAGDQVCVTVTANPGSGSVDAAGNVTSAGPSDPKEACATVVDRPYLAVFGNDVMVGGTFGGGGACPDDARISTWYSQVDDFGSGVQFAAQALGAINEFGSAIKQGDRPVKLTFANTGASPPSSWGGNFGVCNTVTNFWNVYDADSLTPKTTSINTDNGINLYSGNKTISGLSVPNGRIVVALVDGDVTINGNIGYSNTSWADTDDIPLFVLIARGNIYINHSVTNLSGIYIAQPQEGDGSTGRIYTCTDGSDLFDLGELDGNCRNNQLRIDGSLIAQQIKLLRTINSLRDGEPGDTANTSDAAEIINFSPEVYLANVCKVDGWPGCGTGQNQPYNAIMGLPPVL